MSITINVFSDLLEEYGRDNIYFHIVQVGCGGNGSYVCQQTAQLLSIFKKRAFYILADADIVEEKNLKNQLFIKQDLGRKKAEVLAERYGSHYGVNMGSFDVEYVESTEILASLFDQDVLEVEPNELVFPILLGCVDNNFTRRIMHEFFRTQDNILYLDVGCEAAKVPQDGRPPSRWTKEEIKEYIESGYTGQAVAGLRLDGTTILGSVVDEFTEILDDKDDIAPSELSCQSIVANEPQRLVTNRMAAMSVYPYLNDLFELGSISNHITYFHSKKAFMRSTPIKL